MWSSVQNSRDLPALPQPDRCDTTQILTGSMDGRQVSQQPTSEPGFEKQKFITSVADKSYLLAGFIGKIIGGLAAALLSVATFGMGLAIWNSSHDNNNDLFTVFMNQGQKLGQHFSRIIAGR